MHIYIIICYALQVFIQASSLSSHPTWHLWTHCKVHFYKRHLFSSHCTLGCLKRWCDFAALGMLEKWTMNENVGFFLWKKMNIFPIVVLVLHSFTRTPSYGYLYHCISIYIYTYCLLIETNKDGVLFAIFFFFFFLQVAPTLWIHSTKPWYRTSTTTSPSFRNAA